MKLIFIYGPPAAGKLTVAKELSKITGYKLFHNHLTADIVNSLFEYGTDFSFKLKEKVYLLLIEAAAKEKVNGVISTFCYSNPEDDKFIKNIIEKVEKYGGHVDFVQLYPDNKELFKRVKGNSRKKFGKLKSIKGLKKTMKKWDLFTPMPFAKSLKIDNTKLNPKKAALMIKKYYKL